MITDLWIENFKGIGKRQHIPLRPITLLFGANSAGKSTVLHALLYLREAICFHNINPTKPIAGNQTVNLGGIDNLIHVAPDRKTDEFGPLSFSVGFRFSLGGDHQDFQRRWAYDFYANDSNSHGYWCGPGSGDIAVESAATQFLEDFSQEIHNQSDIKFEFSVGRLYSHDEIQIQHLCLSVRDVPLVSGWSTYKGQCHSRWLNIWHHDLLANPSEKEDSTKNQFLHERREQKKSRVVSRILKAAVSDLVRDSISLGVSPISEKGGTFVADLLTCPTQPVWIGPERVRIPQPRERRHSAEHAPSVSDTSLFIRFQDFLAALDFEHGVRNEFFDEATVASLANVFVGINTLGVHEESNGNGAAEFVSPCDLVSIFVRSDATCRLETAVEVVRVACMMEAAAGDFGFHENDTGQLPSGNLNYISSSNQMRQILGMSILGPSSLEEILFDLYRAHIDKYWRDFFSGIRKELNDVCYLGPKRSTVPRSLSSDVMDEFTQWGDGLGAWRWMLTADENGFSRCRDWLSKESPGLQLGFEVERDEFCEVSTKVLLLLKGRHDVYEIFEDDEWTLKRFEDQPLIRTRVYLRDERRRRLQHPQEMGEGVTQVIPVVACLAKASSVSAGGNPLLSAIEQPELHLHPSLAARLGDLLIASTLPLHHSTLLIETHSEHLILRILRRIRQTTDDELPDHIPPVKPDDVCVLWVDNLGDGTTIQRLRIDERGEFIDRWPRGFFSERAEELY